MFMVVRVCHGGWGGFYYGGSGMALVCGGRGGYGVCDGFFVLGFWWWFVVVVVGGVGDYGGCLVMVVMAEFRWLAWSGLFYSGFGFGFGDDEKETERERKETGERRERRGSFIFILLGILYYFISIYVKIETGMSKEL